MKTARLLLNNAHLLSLLFLNQAGTDDQQRKHDNGVIVQGLD